MGERCSPKNLAALFKARARLGGFDFKTDKEVLYGLGDDIDQHLAYEEEIARAIRGQSPLEALEAQIKKDKAVKPRLKAEVKFGFDGVKAEVSNLPSLNDAPSDALPGKFWRPIDAKITKFETDSRSIDRKTKQGREEYYLKYQDRIGAAARETMKKLGDILQTTKGKKLDIELSKKYGLDRSNIAEAMDYLDWLAKGGHTQPGLSNTAIIGTVTRAFPAAMARMNLGWTIYNIGDISRIAAVYAPKKGGIESIAKGLKRTFIDNGGPIGAFKRIKDLEAKGVYEASGGLERENWGNFDPFSWSVTLQKNLAYNISKAHGEDGFTGLKNASFDYKPWDASPLFRNAVLNQTGLGLARFTINEFYWHGRTLKKAILGDTEAASTLGLYFAAKSLLFGTASVLPEVIYNAALSDEQKEEWDKINKEVPFLNLVGKGFDDLFKGLGLEAEADFSKSMQPGVFLGGRFQAISSTLTRAMEAPGKVAKDVVTGDGTGAALDSVVGAMSLANLFWVANPAQGLAGAVGNNILNTTTSTKVVKKFAEYNEEKWSKNKFGREILKALFGERNVKKGDAGRIRRRRKRRPNRTRVARG